MTHATFIAILLGIVLAAALHLSRWHPAKVDFTQPTSTSLNTE